MTDPPLLLASSSPRRVSLLRDAGYAFTTLPADLDEERYPPDLTPDGIAEFLATAKAGAIAGQHPTAVVLGADTVVHLGAQLLGKPSDAAHAKQMLATLSGTTHRVVTGVAVICAARDVRLIRSEASTVQMRVLTPDEIDRYVAGGQWRGKAGGYGIQDDDPFVTNMAGSRTNIVGLPMETATAMLADAGVFPARTGGTTIQAR